MNSIHVFDMLDTPVAPLWVLLLHLSVSLPNATKSRKSTQGWAPHMQWPTCPSLVQDAHRILEGTLCFCTLFCSGDHSPKSVAVQDTS